MSSVESKSSKRMGLFESEFKKQGKKPTMEGWSPLVSFLLCIFLGIPLLLVIILPSTLVFYFMSGTKKKAARPEFFDDPLEEKKAKVKPGIKKREEREFQIVLYGATGFTGKLAAKYTARQYKGKGLKWAIAGRNKAKLEAVRAELAEKIDPELSKLGVIIADSADTKALESMVKRTRVVATSVGPFAKYGSKLVGMCAACGTDYVDITGEADWVKHIIARLSQTAKASGARIVPFCGHDSIPWDLLVQKIATELKDKHGQALKKVEIVDNIRAAVSGGTIATIFNIFNSPLPRPTFGFNPWLCDEDGNKGESVLKLANPKIIGWNALTKQWTSLFLMADFNGKVVQRSNVFNKYGPNVIYSESQGFPSFMAAFVLTFSITILALSLSNPALGYLMRRFILPKPGQGTATEAQMEKGFLHITAVGTGEKGAKVYAELGFFKDPGYMDTGRMLMESGLMLALEDEKLLRRNGGVYTSAACMGTGLLDRLVKTGSTFESF